MADTHRFMPWVPVWPALASKHGFARHQSWAGRSKRGFNPKQKPRHLRRGPVGRSEL